MRHDGSVATLGRELERLGYDELDALPEEECRVLLWRAQQFLELGFGEQEAVALANAPVDLGHARRLIAVGCVPETASRILL